MTAPASAARPDYLRLRPQIPRHPTPSGIPGTAVSAAATAIISGAYVASTLARCARRASVEPCRSSAAYIAYKRTQAF